MVPIPQIYRDSMKGGGFHFTAAGALWCAALWAWVIATAGCAPKEPLADPKRYVPESPQARRALVAVLDAWKAGKAVKDPADSPGILVIDTQRRPEQALDDYRILGEQSWERGRRFVVELTYEEDRPAEKVRFVIIGIDPLLVFRQEDFDMISHWEHAMEEAPAAKPEGEPANEDKEASPTQ